MKKSLSVISAIFFMATLTSCRTSLNNEIFSTTEKHAPKTTVSYYSEYSSDNINTETALSESFDKILASGYEHNGDYYELVANETETYEGVSVEIGVIKNNNWLIPPTTDMPLIDDDGTIYGKEILSIYDSRFNVTHIGNGCFYCYSIHDTIYYSNTSRGNIIYNSETQEYYEEDAKSAIFCLPNKNDAFSQPDYSQMNKLSKQNSLIMTNLTKNQTGDNITYQTKILDTNTMQLTTLSIENPDFKMDYCYQLSEGIFAVSANYPYSIAFCDINGNIILKTDFELNTHNQSIYFRDGKCSFVIKNPNKNLFKITIDINGNVLSSVQLES